MNSSAFPCLQAGVLVPERFSYFLRTWNIPTRVVIPNLASRLFSSVARLLLVKRQQPSHAVWTGGHGAAGHLFGNQFTATTFVSRLCEDGGRRRAGLGWKNASHSLTRATAAC